MKRLMFIAAFVSMIVSAAAAQESATTWKLGDLIQCGAVDCVQGYYPDPEQGCLCVPVDGKATICKYVPSMCGQEIEEPLVIRKIPLERDASSILEYLSRINALLCALDEEVYDNKVVRDLNCPPFAEITWPPLPPYLQ